MSDRTILQPTMNHILRLMEYLKIWSFVIPSYNLPIPEEAQGINYRPDRVFRLIRAGTMTYSGTGAAGGNKHDVWIGGIVPTEEWLTRAFIHLSEKVIEEIRKSINGTNFHFNRLPELILKFNEIDFVDWKENKV